MGTDYVKLFDKRRCDQILALTVDELPSYIEAHRNDLGESSMIRYFLRSGKVTSEAIDSLLADGETEVSLKEDLVSSLCVIEPWIYVDYWGCLVEAFGGVPEGSIQDFDLFPGRQDQSFLLLNSTHIDIILSSLSKHRSELHLMNEKSIEKLRQWRDQCQADPGFMVAYHLD